MRCGAAMALGIACAGTGSKVGATNPNVELWRNKVDVTYENVKLWRKGKTIF